MTSDSSKNPDLTKSLKERQAFQDDKRKGKLFHCRFDDELTQELEHFMISKGFNRNQALRHIVKSFFDIKD